MNSGIQDSFNLAWKLALVQRKLAPHSLLRTYSEERLPVIKEMLERTTKILNSTFKEMNADAMNRGGGLLQLGVNCRWSSVVVDERKRAEDAEDADFADFSFGEEAKEAEPDEEIDSYGMQPGAVLRGGDRAPDAPGLVDLSPGPNARPTQQLFQIFGSSYHTVLVFTPAISQCAHILKTLVMYPQGTIRSAVIVHRGKTASSQSLGADYILEDREEHAHNGYGVEDKWGVAVIRPDGVVGAIVRGHEGLEEYFTGIFGPQPKSQKR